MSDETRYSSISYSSGFSVDPEAFRGHRFFKMEHGATVLKIQFELGRQLAALPWWCRVLVWLAGRRLRNAIDAGCVEPFMEVYDPK